MASNTYIDLFRITTASGREYGLNHWNERCLPYLVSSCTEVVLNRIPRGDILLLIAGNNFMSELIPEPSKSKPELPEYNLGVRIPARETVLIDAGKTLPYEYEWYEHELTLAYTMARFVIATDATVEFTHP